MDNAHLGREQRQLPADPPDSRLLPTLVLSNDREVMIDEALDAAPRLCILAPFGSNIDLLLDYLEFQPVRPNARLVLPLPQSLPPQLDPIDLLMEIIDKQHLSLPQTPWHRLQSGLNVLRRQPAGVQARQRSEHLLTHGQITWLIRGADHLSEERAHWLFNSLQRYPLTRVLAVARVMPPASVFTAEQFATAQLRPPPWPVVENWLAQQLQIPEPILAWIGRQPELRDAVVASPKCREALALSVKAGNGTRGLYAAWIQRLLGNLEQREFERAANLAWQAQKKELCEPPDDLILAKLVYQPKPLRWDFGFPAAQHYLAAQSPFATATSLGLRIGEADWTEVIILWAAQASEAPSFVINLLYHADEASLILALRMVSEMRSDVGRPLEEQVLVAALEWLGKQREWLDERRARYRSLTGKSRELLRTLADYQGMTEKSQPFQVAMALANHPSTSVKLAALQALTGLEDSTVQLKLRERLGDADPQVASAAARALGATGALAIDYLIPLLKAKDSSMRRLAIAALAAIGQPVIMRLTELLNSGDDQGRQGAAEALAEIEPQGLETLLTSLSSSNVPARQAAYQALLERGRRQPEVLLAAVKLFQQDPKRIPQHESTVQLLRDVGKPMLPPLARELRRRGPLATLAVEVLDALILTHGAAKAGSAEETGTEARLSRPVDPVALFGLVYGLQDERVGVRIRCASVLKKFGAYSTPTMLRIIASRPALQLNTLNLLLEMNDRALVERVVEPLIELLERVRDDERYIEIRLAIIRLLGLSASHDACEQVVVALVDSSPLVRKNVAQIFATRSESQFINAVKRQLIVEEEPEVVAALLTTLCAQNPTQAISFALKALAHHSREVCDAAQRVFFRAGLDGVNELIKHVCSPQQRDLPQAERENIREQTVIILKEIGARQTGEIELARTVAQVWHALLTEPMSAMEARDKASALRRWSYAREIISSYEAANLFASYQKIDDMRDVPRMLYWTEALTEWLRPDIYTFFRELRSIAGRAVAFFEKHHVDDLKELHQALTELEKMIDPGRLDLQPLLDIIEPWRRLISSAASDLYDKPDLTLTLLSNPVRLAEVDGVINLVFALRNEGTGVARQVLLRVSKSRFEETTDLTLKDPLQWTAPEISAGGIVLVELTIELGASSKLGSSASIVMPFRLIYEDAAQKTYVPDIEVHIPVETTMYPSYPVRFGDNPYVAGPPVYTDNIFFGRQETLDRIFNGLDRVNDQHNHLLIVYGERRTGKTSVLRRVEYMMAQRHAQNLFVLVDFQDMPQGENGHANPFIHITKCLREQLFRKDIKIGNLGDDYANLPAITQFQRLRDQTIKSLGTGKLVLMLDEFDTLLADVHNARTDRATLSHVRNLYQVPNRTLLILSGLHRTRRSISDYKSEFLGADDHHRLTFLEKRDALRLIQEPVQDQVKFSKSILDRMYEVTHGHPFLIQVMCIRLFERLKARRRGEVDHGDLMFAIRDTLYDESGFFEGIYNDLDATHKLILVAIARNVHPGRLIATPGEIDQLLQTYRVELPPERRGQILNELEQRDLIQREKPGYRFAMDLTRMWFSEYRDLSQELRDLTTQSHN